MLVDFIAYAGDCRVTGLFDLAEGARLSDALNAASSITLTNATPTSHADDHSVDIESVDIQLADLLRSRSSERAAPRTSGSTRFTRRPARRP